MRQNPHNKIIVLSIIRDIFPEISDTCKLRSKGIMVFVLALPFSCLHISQPTYLAGPVVSIFQARSQNNLRKTLIITKKNTIKQKLRYKKKYIYIYKITWCNTFNFKTTDGAGTYRLLPYNNGRTPKTSCPSFHRGHCWNGGSENKTQRHL